MTYWSAELADFRSYLSAHPGHDYRDWQPTKWQSLLTVCDLLTGLDGVGSALELGCGSATLLTQLQAAGVDCVGVDRDPVALELAEQAAATLGTPAPRLVSADFDDDAVTAGLAPADLVFHIGVIEHFEPERQRAFLELSAAKSKRWVLVAVPNEHGAVFRSFLRTVTVEGRVYEDSHEEISVPDLASAAGLRLVAEDGAHLFFGRAKYYNAGDRELDALYETLADRLRKADSERYGDFPRRDFTAADIETLRAAEEFVSRETRLRCGFLRYYLLEKQAGDVD
ncbi:class I SAM-dependent methyltransferase [Streptomyces sp. NBC_01716]|uniref:class I SAM-dependent methyltransferase n=1 Tax=Streptomyces sp. NBC_01716 TaxID=2975917 RepID=UPI002E3667E1|nr:class I SAM-dependent methyltransferase [Streptomyces sp. NBC_01716]